MTELLPYRHVSPSAVTGCRPPAAAACASASARAFRPEPLPARWAADATCSRPPLFAGPRVRLDEDRWSPSFAAQVGAWASDASLLVVVGDGSALAWDHRAPPSCLESRDFAPAGDPRPAPLCAVFRFERGVVASMRRAATDSLAPESRRWPAVTDRIVRLAPHALFRYYWRRRALELRYPSPAEHVEDDALALLRHVVGRACPPRRLAGDDSPGRVRQRALARDAQRLMALTLADPHPIAQIARTLGASPFHLAHVFRTEVGVSLHQYLVQLRLTAAVDRLRAGARDLSKLALELGFSHHSHFSAVFRQAIGYTPRDVRRMLTAECIADLGIATRQPS